MKKNNCIKIVIFSIVFVVIVVYVIILLKHIINKKIEYDAYIKSIEGMKVTMLGGSNMEDKGNVNSMGYFIRTRENQLIFIDGGRDIDTELVKDYINKYGGKVDHWFVTHPHSDHVGALLKIIEEGEIEVNNLYYSVLLEEWYKENDKRAYETEKAFLECLKSNQIKNQVNCKKGQVIKIDNIRCDIIRIANEQITNSDNGNEASMIFKITATDVNKSILFLGDAYVYVSKELLEEPERLKADSVQMSHHGQNGVTKEVYMAINPEVCFFNAPKWLYNNDNGGGYNSGNWQSVIVRGWLEELGTRNYIAYEGNQTFRFFSDGIVKIEE